MKKLSSFPSREELRAMKQREIVRCASVKFGKEGYENVSLDAIAAELGVTKAALYNYVASKNDLLMRCYEVGMDALVEAVNRGMAESGTAAERLQAALKAYILVMTRSDMQYLWSYTRPMVTAGNRRGVQVSRDEIDRLIRQLLREGVKDGSMQPGLDPKLASLVILGAVNWIGIWFRSSGPMKAAEIAEQVSREALRGYLSHP